MHTDTRTHSQKGKKVAETDRIIEVGQPPGIFDLWWYGSRVHKLVMMVWISGY